MIRFFKDRVVNKKLVNQSKKEGIRFNDVVPQFLIFNLPNVNNAGLVNVEILIFERKGGL